MWMFKKLKEFCIIKKENNSMTSTNTETRTIKKLKEQVSTQDKTISNLKDRVNAMKDDIYTLRSEVDNFRSRVQSDMKSVFEIMKNK